MNLIKVYCIVVTYNGEKYINKCLRSLLKSDYPIKIVIIDNNSTDKTLSIIAEYSNDIELVSLKKNIGFGGANNIGIKYSHENAAEYVFLLNQDVYVKKTAIRKLVAAAEDNPRFGIISPIHLNGDGKSLDSLFAKFISPPSCKLFIDADKGCEEIKKIYECSFVNAAAWLVSKSCYQLIGGFDPIFHHYGEDNDYINRVIFKGKQVGIIHNAYIRHDRSFHNLNSYSQYYQKRLRYFIMLKDLRYKYIGVFFFILGKIFKMIFKNLINFRCKGLFTDIRLIMSLVSNFFKLKSHRDKCLNEKMPFI